MSMSTYRQLFHEAYEGEIVGEALYRLLSECRADSVQSRTLAMIADVERRTHGTLRVVASRLNIEPVRANIAATVARRAEQLKQLTWREFIDKAVADWPPYVGQFETLHGMAPAVDAPAVLVLVEHERALVEFARLEQQRSSESLRPLEMFLVRGNEPAVESSPARAAD